MDMRTFLEQVTPEQGYLILATPYDIANAKTNPMEHYVSDDMGSILRKAYDWNFTHKNVFFALAGFKAPKVWDPNAKKWNPQTLKYEVVGKYRSRTQANAGWMRCFFLDLDVDPDPDERKALVTFPSKENAVAELRAVCKKVRLPKPLLVDSGGGIHVYWPLNRDVTVDEWVPIAERLKAILIQENLKIDPVVPADTARVLRPIGCHNLKKDAARPVFVLQESNGPYAVEVFIAAFDAYEQDNGPVRVAAKSSARAAATNGLTAGGGLEKTYDPIDFGQVMFHCPAVGDQVADRGALASEPLWFAMLGLAKFAKGDPDAAMRAVSDGHPDFTEEDMQAKASGWHAGWTSCATIANHVPATCAACPHRDHIKSPAQFGKHKDATPLTDTQLDSLTGLVTTQKISPAPFPYRVADNKVWRIAEMPTGETEFVEICPNAFYPLRIMRTMQNGMPVECSDWRVSQHSDADIVITIQHAWLANSQTMQTALSNAGVYFGSKQSEECRNFMSAYLKQLAGETRRERIFDRLGWVGDTHTEGFAVGRIHVLPDGNVQPCNVTTHVSSCTKNHLAPAGEFSKWNDAMQFYSGSGFSGHRFFLYLALGAPIFHMTGYKGMIVNAVGESGRGKTTCLHACSSIWGGKESLLINGNPHGSTDNALGNLMGTFHSLPVLLDEITERDEFAMAEFCLNVSQGRGKERMHGNEHDGRTVVWETPVLTSANSDVISRIMATQKNTSPHLMRAIGVDFQIIDTSPAAIQRANAFIRTIEDNHGHAGIAFMRYVTANYAVIKQIMERTIDELFAAVGSGPEERYWIAAVATAMTAARIAQKVGFWQYFPLSEDYEWMKVHVTNMRAAVQDSRTAPAEILSEFLDDNIAGTLVLSQKIASNVDNIAVRPRDDLIIRTEMDVGMAFVSKAAIRKYCLKEKVNWRDLEGTLSRLNIVVDTARQCTLGKGTPYASGQIRCWAIDLKALDPNYTTLLANAAAAQGNNVVPLRVAGT